MLTRIRTMRLHLLSLHLPLHLSLHLPLHLLPLHLLRPHDPILLSKHPHHVLLHTHELHLLLLRIELLERGIGHHGISSSGELLLLLGRQAELGSALLWWSELLALLALLRDRRWRHVGGRASVRVCVGSSLSLSRRAHLLLLLLLLHQLLQSLVIEHLLLWRHPRLSKLSGLSLSHLLQPHLALLLHLPSLHLLSTSHRRIHHRLSIWSLPLSLSTLGIVHRRHGHSELLLGPLGCSIWTTRL